METSSGLIPHSPHSSHSPPGVPSTPAAVTGTLHGAGAPQNAAALSAGGDSKFKVGPHLRDSFESCSEFLGGAGAGWDSPAAGTQGGCKDISVTESPARTQTIRNCIYLEKYSVIVHLEFPKPRLEQPPGRECWVRQSNGHFHIPKGLLPMPTLCLTSCPLSLAWEDRVFHAQIGEKSC